MSVRKRGCKVDKEPKIIRITQPNTLQVVSARSPRRQPTFESLCIHDLRVYTSCLPDAYPGPLHYYGDSDGLEVDAVIELRGGRARAGKVGYNRQTDETKREQLGSDPMNASTPAENEPLRAALRHYDEVRDTYLRALGEHGVEFAPAGSSDAEIARLRGELEKRGAQFRNAGASIRMGWISKACIECTGNKGSETFSTTFKCHRDCYFCFNHNQADYDKFFREGCPWEEGLDRAAKTYENGLAVIGLTGGEPLLSFEDSIRFLNRARELFPEAHKRMYTSGDLLTEDMARRLRDADLQEIRFSVKDFDPERVQERVLDAMRLAKRYIPDVMVEMPIIPGTEARMKELLASFEEIGIRGINMLEFCFPFHSWDEFARRGLSVRNPPFDVMYDYGYSGGLPIAGSEELALSLMIWAHDQGFSFGMHYCSLDNKHRSEMRQRNERAAHAHPCFTFDEGDFFLKAGKVFGPDREVARPVLATAGCTAMIDSDEEDSTTFPVRYLNYLRGVNVTPAVAFAVLESDENGSYIQELDLRVVE